MRQDLGCLSRIPAVSLIEEKSVLSGEESSDILYVHNQPHNLVPALVSGVNASFRCLLPRALSHSFRRARRNYIHANIHIDGEESTHTLLFICSLLIDNPSAHLPSLTSDIHNLTSTNHCPLPISFRYIILVQERIHLSIRCDEGVAEEEAGQGSHLTQRQR